METINQIIKRVGKSKPALITRVKYDFNLKTAFHIWERLAKAQIKEEIIINEEIKEHWINMIKYIFASDNSVYDVEKSIFLRGITGSGKTLTFEVLNPFVQIDDVYFYLKGRKTKFDAPIFTAKEISEMYKMKGYEGLFNVLKKPVILIDDVGDEPKIENHFGTKINVIQHVLKTRFDNNLFTHITSNLVDEEFQERYGDRVWSRMKAKCNFIALVEQDFRDEESKL